MKPEKTIIITGATGGIGLAAMHSLADENTLIIGVGRSAERCQQAKEKVLARKPEANVRFELADLSSMEQIRQLGQRLRAILDEESGGKLDVLVNNAGMITNAYTPTIDGYETQFAVNHLAYFLLTHELLAYLKRADHARLLNVSSRSHRWMRMIWPDVMMKKFYNVLLAYKQSKLANVLFTAEFNRRHAEQSSMRAYAIHPGLVNTSIGLKGTSGITNLAWKLRSPTGVSPEEGAATVVHLAREENLADAQAVYWRDMQPWKPSRYAMREDVARRLWELSEEMCGIDKFGL